MRNYIFLFILLGVLTACNKSQNSEKLMLANDAIMEEDISFSIRESAVNPPAPSPPPVKTAEIQKKIIKDGDLRVETKNITTAKSSIDSLAKKYNAYYANENLSNSDYQTTLTLKIRIPSKYFEAFIAKIESGKDKILHKNISARDVTEEFIDLETRLKNKRNYLQRYNELLKKAKSVKEILEIEEKIRGIEEEIESTEGRLKYLSNQVDFSTLDLTLIKKKDYTYNPEKRDSFFERLKQSVSKGWFWFVDFLLFMLKMWPFWIIALIIIRLWKRFRKRKKKKKMQ